MFRCENLLLHLNINKKDKPECVISLFYLYICFILKEAETASILLKFISMETIEEVLFKSAFHPLVAKCP